MGHPRSLAMEYFCNLTPIEIEAMGNYSRKLAIKYFDDEVIIQKYFEVIEGVMKRKKLFPKKIKTPS